MPKLCSDMDILKDVQLQRKVTATNSTGKRSDDRPRWPLRQREMVARFVAEMGQWVDGRSRAFSQSRQCAGNIDVGPMSFCCLGQHSFVFEVALHCLRWFQP